MCVLHREHTVKVNASIAALHHYKSCSTNLWKDRSCPESFKMMIADDIMLSYEIMLRSRVAAVERDMQKHKYNVTV